MMTKYIINCGQTLQNILVIAKKKSLELIVKHIKLMVKLTMKIFWRNDQTNWYIRALNKQEGPL